MGLLVDIGATAFHAAPGCDEMAAMAREWTDAEFEVVFAPPRKGDPHPTRKGWRYVRTNPATGMTYWHAPPRMGPWRLALTLIVGAPLLGVAVYYLALLLGHYWPR